jgi:hypothetical protein
MRQVDAHLYLTSKCKLTILVAFRVTITLNFLTAMAQSMSIVSNSAAGKKHFDVTPEQLGTLHAGDLKNAAAFLRFGGIDGLVKGLHSDQTKGLGQQATLLDSNLRQVEV